MKWPWQKIERKTGEFETVLQRLVAAQEGNLTATVTPDNCMESPTVHAIVTAVSRRLEVTPVHVFQKTFEGGREKKELLPGHSVAKLLKRPNAWQTSEEFWADAASVFMRWGRFHCYKGRAATGPIRELIPLQSSNVDVKQDEKNYTVTYEVTSGSTVARQYRPDQMFNARGPARDFVKGDSPVKDIHRTIGLEILAEKHGYAFFRNGALPFLVMEYAEGAQAFQTKDQEEEFIASFKAAFTGGKKFNSLLMPKGIKKPEPISVDHDKAQVIESRRFQRTVIAGAWGVPPHFVGDLERATFNNVEQQDSDFTLNVIMPVCKAFEGAMERDLLTDSDRRQGVVIRFNLDSYLRADFKSRQEGLQIQRQNGAINANEWREIEGRNRRDDDAGDEYWDTGPSGQGSMSDETTPDNTP